MATHNIILNAELTSSQDEPIKELKFVPPLGKDIQVCGLPMTFNTEGEVTVNTKIVAQYISRLSGLPLNLVGELSARDFQGCLEKVLNFFDSAPST